MQCLLGAQELEQLDTQLIRYTLHALTSCRAAAVN